MDRIPEHEHHRQFVPGTAGRIGEAAWHLPARGLGAGGSGPDDAVLASRARKAAVTEAERTSQELAAIGVRNQRLILNGLFKAADSDPVALALDTALTGHTLLLLDATEAYHREVARKASGMPEEVRKLLPRLRDASFTRALLVTLPEATPVHEAAALQDDLRRAPIEPFVWSDRTMESARWDGSRGPRATRSVHLRAAERREGPARSWQFLLAMGLVGECVAGVRREGGRYRPRFMRSGARLREPPQQFAFFGGCALRGASPEGLRQPVGGTPRKIL